MYSVGDAMKFSSPIVTLPSLQSCQSAVRSLINAFALTVASTFFPVGAQAATYFLQLYEIDSGHSVCNNKCTQTFSGSPITLPATTFSGTATHITASGGVSANTINSFASANVAVEYDLGISDTYTVHGSVGGLFPITTTFGATGIANTVQSGPNQVNIVGNASVKIGTYSVDTTSFPSGPYATVTPFDLTTQATTGSITIVNGPSVPISISASYTRMVSVGDVFDIAYMLASAFGIGEIDLSHTATISFTTPAGVYLTSDLGGVFGDAPTTGATPVPAALPLFATGLGVMGLLGWRKKRKSAAATA